MPIAILLIGALLRIYGMDRFPFEQDELYTEIEARLLFDSPLNPGIEARPLYYLLQHPLLRIWPVEHVALRVLPVIFGIAGLWVTWLLARRFLGRVAAGTALLLVALSPWHLHASGMARYWSLIYLLSALFVFCLLSAYEEDRPRWYLGALGALVLGAATHPTFLFPVVGVVLAISLVDVDGSLGIRWPSRRAWTYLWLPFLLVGASAYAALKLTGESGAIKNWDGRGWLASARLIPAMVEWLTPIVFAAGALGAIVLLLTGDDARRRRWGAVAVLGTVSALGLLMAASLSTSVYADYGIAMLPLVFVSAGGLIQAGYERMRTGAGIFAAAAALLLVAAMLPSTVSHMSDGTRFDYRPALAQIQATAPDVTVLTTPIILQRHYAPGLQGHELITDRASLDALLAAEGDAWAIVPVRREGVWQDGSGEIAAWVAANCRWVSTHERPRLDYRMYRTDLYRCARDESA